jgi:hypothetical protein
MRVGFDRLTPEMLAQLQRLSSAGGDHGAEGFVGKTEGIFRALVKVAIGVGIVMLVEEATVPAYTRLGGLVLAGALIGYGLLRFLALLSSSVKPCVWVGPCAVVKSGLLGEPLEVHARADFEGDFTTHHVKVHAGGSQSETGSHVNMKFRSGELSAKVATQAEARGLTNALRSELGESDAWVELLHTESAVADHASLLARLSRSFVVPSILGGLVGAGVWSLAPGEFRVTTIADVSSITGVAIALPSGWQESPADEVRPLMARNESARITASFRVDDGKSLAELGISPSDLKQVMKQPIGGLDVELLEGDCDGNECAFAHVTGGDRGFVVMFSGPQVIDLPPMPEDADQDPVFSTRDGGRERRRAEIRAFVSSMRKR